MGVVNITKILTVHFTESVKDILENKIHSGFIHIAPRKRDKKSKMQTFSLFPYCSILILQQELNKTPNSKAHPWWGKFRHRAPLAVSGSRSSISDLKANDMVRENRWKTDRELGLKQLSSSLALTAHKMRCFTSCLPGQLLPPPTPPHSQTHWQNCAPWGTGPVPSWFYRSRHLETGKKQELPTSCPQIWSMANLWHAGCAKS